MASNDRASNVRLALTTEADERTARALARKLLDLRVVACVTMIPVSSMYHWGGEIESCNEVQLLLKTTADRSADLENAIAELSSYDVPEFVILDADAGDAYARWVASVVFDDTESTT